MNNKQNSEFSKSARRPRLRTKILLAVNTVLLVGVFTLLVIDYRMQISNATKDKLDKLDTEATILSEAIVSIKHHGNEAIQDHVDRVCARMMATTSPGHHIAITTASNIYQARSHHRDSPALLTALRSTVDQENPTVIVDGETILVGMDRKADVTVFISENLDDVYQDVRGQLMWRILGFGALGLVGAGVVNFILIRLVTDPISRLVDVVQRSAAEDFAGTSETPRTAELAFLTDELNTMNQSLALAKSRREATMRQARRIQSYLLPESSALCAVGIELIHQPADDVGGDFFDVRTTEDGTSIVCLADVTGHGVPAAMTATMLKILFNQAVDRTHNLSQILATINDALVTYLPDEVFATMFVARIDHESRELVYASAGHEPGYLVDGRSPVRTLDSTGMLLGVSRECKWDEMRLDIEENEVVILCTDGLAESASPSGELLGRQRLQELIECSLESPKSAECQEIVDAVTDFRGNRIATDDITVVSISIESVSSSSSAPDSDTKPGSC